MVTAKDFVARFVEAYAECRRCFSDSSEWNQVWTTHWNRFVLWNPVAPQPKPLLGLVAERLGLVLWDREPFRLDGAMVPADHHVIGNCPLPLLVGIEHENNLRTFVEEIAKLVHVICPLKVGITYIVTGGALPSPAVVDDARSQIQRLAHTALSNRNQHIREDPTTEYLFLLGVESRIRECDWFALSFTAAAGPATAAWSKLPG